MREIKFRGMKRNGKWIYGYYMVNAFGEHTIVAPGEVEKVDAESVGQFTGLLDKQGKEIYEGDITNYGVVEWCECLNWDSGGSNHPGFYFKDKYEYERGDLSYHVGFDSDIEVYENPELIA